MSDLPRLSEHTEDIDDVIFKRKYGWRRSLIGVVILLCIVIPIICGIKIAFFTPSQTVLPATAPTVSPPTPILTVSSHNICTDPTFHEDEWNLMKSGYTKDTNGYYIPSRDAQKKFLYPPMEYKKGIPALFKELQVEYEANYRDPSSTQSAVLYASLIDSDGRKVFEINFPEPNRQLIRLNTENPYELTPTVSPTHSPTNKFTHKNFIYRTSCIGNYSSTNRWE